MIRHVVMFRWSEARAEDELQRLGAALDALPGLIPGVVSYQHGRDLGLADTNYDYAVTGVFADAAALAVYRDHEAHQRFLADHIVGRTADRVAVQFDVDG
ncbi:MAG: Dabb family protein [Ilumatobacteraceae bacterium]